MIESDASWKLFDTIKSIASSNGQSTNAMATCVRVLSDGTRMMQLVGSSILTPLNGSMAAEISQGDMAEVRIEDGVMSLTANVSNPSVGQSEVDDAVADRATVRQLDESNARIGRLEVTALTAESATIANLQADTAKVHDLTADQLTAATAYVGALDAGNVTAAQLIADHATVGALDSTYAKVDMANVNNAWISSGTIKDGAIVSAMINDVSANKLTAGTINGSVINVTNLNADNITAGTINGQRIGEGSLSLDKLSEDVYTEAEVNDIVDGLNDRIDGAIETFTGTAVPTLNNSPASSWNTTKLRDEHVGDVYYVVNSQSQQNGYCYRFTKSGSTYSWQLIKDSDVTAALSRLTTAEGKITTFDSDISQLKTDTGTLTTKTESLETRMSDAEEDILDKVDTTTFNEVSDTVDQHSQTISQHTTAISNKADSSTVTAVTNRVSKNEQDISGINTTIGELQETVESKADGSTVSTISNKLNTVSDTVDGHTQTLTSVQNTLSTKADSSTVSTLSTKVNNVSDTVDGHTSQLSSITSTQTSMQTTLDKTVKSSIQLWYSKANTTAPSKPTSQVTSTSTNGNAWRIVVPAYNASYPHYFYCWQYEYVDGTYGWSAVVRDIAMGESQSTARTADSNASAAVTTANTASTNASTALTTANTANTNASDAKTAAATANTTASEAKTTAETAASDASTAKTNAASAVSTANSASTTATNAQSTANANIKSSVQLWFTKANSTAPNKPTSVVSTSNANTANSWNLVVPVWNKSYPHYFYCYQQQKGDGNYQWTDVVYDRATSEAQQLANTTSTSLTTLQEDYATYKQTTTENVSSIGTRLTTAEGKITTAESNITQNATNINAKVSKNDVINQINLSTEGAKIQASKVEIDGTAVFSAIKSQADAAYDAKNAASTALSDAKTYADTKKSEAISTAAADATSKANAAQTAATNAANTATDQKLTSYSTTQQMNEAIQDANGPLFHGKDNSSGYIHLGHVSYRVSSLANYSHLHLTGRIGGWLSTNSGSIDVTFKSRENNALYNTVDRRDETVNTSFVDVLVYTGTDGYTHYWLKVNSYWYAQLYAEFEQFVEDGHALTTTEPDGTCVWKLSEHTAVAAPKTQAVSRTQRIWYRKSAAGAPATPGTASSNWVTKADDGDNAWTKMHVAISSSAKYIYTCEQYEMADGTVGYTDVLLDNTITVIDGGNIITGSVTANKLNASDINASKTLTVGAMTDAAAATILNSNVQVGGRNLYKSTTSTNLFGNGSVTAYDPSYHGFTLTTAGANQTLRIQNVIDQTNVPYTISFTCTASVATNVAIDVMDNTIQRFDVVSGTSRIVCTSTPFVAIDDVYNFVDLAFGASGTFKLSDIKIERGNKPTDWSPAPEDVDAAVSDAAKTATNYIVADSSGIKIANADPASSTTYQHQTSSGTDFVVNGGVRNRVDSTGMTLYNGSGTADANIVAKFTEALIEIGKNSTSAVIKFCGGVASLTYTTVNKFFNITALRAALRGVSEYENTETANAQVAAQFDVSSDGNTNTAILLQTATSSTASSNMQATAYGSPSASVELGSGNNTSTITMLADYGLKLNNGPTYIKGFNFGYSTGTTNSNGITTFNPGMGVKPTAVFVAAGKASNETEAVAKIAVPMVWSIDGATQVQVRWQRSDTNAWLTSNAVGYYWLAIY